MKNSHFDYTHAKPVVDSSELTLPWRVLKAGFLYFGLVFAVGFVLGAIRLLWAVPQFGVRVAELMETPLMLVTTILTTRWVVRRGIKLGASI